MTTRKESEHADGDAQSAKRIAVLGGGSWGTALGHHLSLAGHSVLLWARDQAVVTAINTKHRNARYFGEIELAPSLRATSDQLEAVSDSAVVVVAVPSTSVRQVAKTIYPQLSRLVTVVSTVKGLEPGSLKSMSAVLEDELREKADVAVLSGPSFAREVIVGLPTAVTVAAGSMQVAMQAGRIFHFGAFRVYTAIDLIGVEYGGALKNIYAVAAGMIDGAGMGTNARAALITRGIAEMKRLVAALGGKRETVSGLSGLGDLVLTATGELSRNRQVGFRLGQGEKLGDIVSSLGQVAEAVTTTAHASELARRHHVEVPIIDAVSAVLDGQFSVKEAVKALLSRAQRTEDTLC